jgi:hypothetical protein
LAPLVDAPPPTQIDLRTKPAEDERIASIISRQSNARVQILLRTEVHAAKRAISSHQFAAAAE